MPGVSSPGLTVHKEHVVCQRKCQRVSCVRTESHQDEDGISEWVGQRRTVWLRYDGDALE